MDTVQQFRQRQRAQAMVDRGGWRKGRCDLCKQARPTDYHEIVSRGRTLYNEEARRFSYHKELCGFMCNECHLTLAHNPQMATKLLAQNCVRYGWMRVKALYDTLDSLLTSYTEGVPFPSENGFPDEVHL